MFHPLSRQPGHGAYASVSPRSPGTGIHTSCLYIRIRVRRIKDFHSEHPTILDESEEYFNSHDELDVTRLNISKPGELYRVGHISPNYDIWMLTL